MSKTNIIALILIIGYVIWNCYLELEYERIKNKLKN